MNLSWQLRTSFEAYVREHCTQPVRIRWHQNRHTMISLAPTAPLGWKLSLHQGFSAAPEEIQRALTTYLNTRRRDAWATVRHYAATLPVTPCKKAVICRTEGTTYDLDAIQKKVEGDYFDRQSLARITWKTYRRAQPGKKRRSIRFGQYDPVENLILVNDLLDHPEVHPDFVEFIVYHESLHAVHPPERQGHRTVYHHRAFRQQERAFPNFQHMQKLGDIYLKKFG